MKIVTQKFVKMTVMAMESVIMEPVYVMMDGTEIHVTKNPA